LCFQAQSAVLPGWEPQPCWEVGPVVEAGRCRPICGLREVDGGPGAGGGDADLAGADGPVGFGAALAVMMMCALRWYVGTTLSP